MARKKIGEVPRLRVWIELDKPHDAEHAKKLEDLVYNMLSRLNAEPSPRTFKWDEKEDRWMLASPMGYTLLNDNGEWFNLEWFGRPYRQGE